MTSSAFWFGLSSKDVSYTVFSSPFTKPVADISFAFPCPDWLAAVSLFALTPSSAPPSSDRPVAWFAEKSFQSSAQLLAKTLFAQGDVSYLEAVNQGKLKSDSSVSVVKRLTTYCF
jgi:hypothetical protein